MRLSFNSILNIVLESLAVHRCRNTLCSTPTFFTQWGLVLSYGVWWIVRVLIELYRVKLSIEQTAMLRAIRRPRPAPRPTVAHWIEHGCSLLASKTCHRLCFTNSGYANLALWQNAPSQKSAWGFTVNTHSPQQEYLFDPCNIWCALGTLLSQMSCVHCCLRCHVYLILLDGFVKHNSDGKRDQ